MSRRRYLSTDISIDTAVNRLARAAGDFAVMLYTWMIPHAADDASLPSDPEELMFVVIPGRHDKSVEDVVAALEAMRDSQLIIWDGDGIHIDLDRWDGRRNSTGRYQKWRKAVLKRDGHACRICGSSEPPLHVHHKMPWAAYPDERFEISNGLTLCERHHRALHTKAVR